jgi:hypothetical protein
MCFENGCLYNSAVCRNEKWDISRRIVKIIELTDFYEDAESLINNIRWQSGKVKTVLQPTTVLVYWSICIRQIQTAVGICKNASLPLLNFIYRLYDRVMGSCCADVAAAEGLASIIDKYKELERG